MRARYGGSRVALIVLLAWAGGAAAESDADLAKRFSKATEVLTEMASGKDAEIPAGLLAQARGHRGVLGRQQGSDHLRWPSWPWRGQRSTALE